MTPCHFLTAEWRYLSMFNYEANPEILLPYVPKGTELDTWQGRTYISMVGFLFLRTRVLGLSIPFHIDFEEINLRFYVRRQTGNGWQRGVVFIKEIVPKAAIARVARTFYNENFVVMPMRHALHPPAEGIDGGLKVEYAWRFRNQWNRMELTTRGCPQELTPGSLEEYIAEHYWGYAVQRDGSCLEYQVERPPWRIWQVEKCHLECQVAALYSPPFAPYLLPTPVSAFLAEGSPVILQRGLPLDMASCWTTRSCTAPTG
jgi:uncharacterized protein YqjF (DUF2071 family)